MTRNYKFHNPEKTKFMLNKGNNCGWAIAEKVPNHKFSLFTIFMLN